MLSAVALTNFNLASGITILSEKSPTDFIYAVRMFKQVASGFQRDDVQVEFNGNFLPSDVRSSDPNEFWPTLYQRANLSLESSLGQDYHDPIIAFGALTGTLGIQMSAASVLPSTLALWLNTGIPLIAGTVNAGDPYQLDPAQGVIGDHSYTVIGMEVPASGAASGSNVILRNPWGIDSTPPYEFASES
ncbi:MAG: C2 family cysteine protease [Isosphaerales bacterium]